MPGERIKTNRKLNFSQPSTSSMCFSDNSSDESMQLSSLKRDGGRSAFTPYRPSTVLTNLQRGNVQTQTPVVIPERSIHHFAAQGELFSHQLDDIDVDEVDENGLTSLLWASSYGQLVTVKLLLSKGANPSFRGRNGETALHLASANGHIHIIKELLSANVDVNDVDEDGNTSLMFAAFNNHAVCCNELLKAGADITLINSNLDTAFSIAIKKGCKQVQIILEKHMLSLLT